MKKKGYDFSGWVTKNDIRCSDGVVIKHNAFLGNHNKRVPLVWMHNHNDPGNVLGHVDLDSRNEGVYGYGYFNGSSSGQDALELVQHGDIVSMSIAANGIKRENGHDVVHGNIYEVSLVLAGANPGALIDNIVQHDANSGEAAVIYTDTVIHSAQNPDDEEDDADIKDLAEKIQNALTDEELMQVFEYAKSLVGKDVPNEEVFDNLTEDQIEKVSDKIMEILGQNGSEIEQSDAEGETAAQETESEEAAETDEDAEDDDDISDEEKEMIEEFAKTLTEEQIKDIEAYAKKIANGKSLDSLTEEQLIKVGDYIEKKYILDDDESEEDDMKHNLFENKANSEEVLVHSQLCSDILQDAESCGSLKASMIKHGVSATIDDLLMGTVSYDGEIQHSISNIDTLLTVEQFEGAPELQRPEAVSIVDKILGKVKTTPKHTVRKRYADLTTAEARAKGYIKGNEKLEEVFAVFDRVTYPQTIYKKQSIDNDDLIDIDWDIVSFIRSEMKEMWRYELARCIFISDGRASGSPDKIKEDRIRPIMADDAFYTTKVYSTTKDNFVDNFITHMATSYKGTGMPDLYIDKMLLAQIRLQKDDNGRYIWGDRPISKSDLADTLGVAEIIEPDFLANTGSACGVNLGDYEVAAPAKGKSQSYEDFDIDYNKHKYLLEGRCAGALNVPKSAVAFFKEAAPSA